MEVATRLKGLDLIDRVPDELWMEVRDIVQETGIKTIPKKKKCKEAKWLSEEGLQIAVKRREGKSKGQKEIYTYLNADFQRIAKRDKKAFLSNQYKEIEENKRMRKTRDLFRKIRDTKGTFHAKMGTIKDRNGMDLTESESESHSVMSDSLQPHGLYSPRNSPGQNTGVGSLSLLQGIFPTQGSNPGLLHCRQILYQLSHKGSILCKDGHNKGQK